ncbi:iron chelate uptake ABC transporter family permease subunit [Corynebacterium sp. H128]|uniref:FecCD family ABC transporter permease n=1 Tax=Corynebacterium sp. H128 TaxID=3133427 RepID=UPI0030B526CB
MTRNTLIAAGLFLAILFAAFIALAMPGAGMSSAKAFAVLTGNQQGLARTVVLQWRAPRILTALLVGAALGIAGSFFQAVTRNPLGSPDVIGFSTGAYTGVIVAMLLGLTEFRFTVLGALLGGIATSLVIVALSVRTRIDGLRIILVGLGISAMLSALNRWLITQGDLEAMMSAATWGAGSLNGIRWPLAGPACLALAIAIAAALPLRRYLDALALGDLTATALGLRVNLLKLVLLLAGVLLIAATTAVAGPIAFIALAAPHIAQRTTLRPKTPLLVSALTGATLLIVADILAQRAFAPVQLPVGLVTVVIGGGYLLYLISSSTTNR